MFLKKGFIFLSVQQTLFALLCCFLFSFKAHSQQELKLDLPKNNKETAKSKVTNPDLNSEVISKLVQEEENSDVRVNTGNFAFQSNQLAEGSGEDIGNKYFMDFNFTYISRQEDSDTEKFLDFSARTNDASLVMLSFKQLYVGTNPRNENLRIRAGRFTLDWSTLDQIWGFGKINNRVNFDFFDPGQEGLAGMAVDIKLNNFVKLKTFGSVVYVPELNPSLDINVDDGTIKSRHPWAKAPPATTDAAGTGTTSTLFYDVKYPEIQDVVWNYTAGLNLEFTLSEHYSVDAFYIRKPDNNIGLAADPIIEPSGDVINVEIQPAVFYQDVSGGQVKYKNRGFEIYGSYLISKPDSKVEGNQDFFDYTNYKHVKIKEEYGGLGVAHGDESLRWSLNYVARRSRFSNDKDNPLEEEPRWSEALNVNVRKSFSQKLSASFDTKFDIFTYDRLFSFSTAYAWTKSMSAVMGFNIIGSNNNQETYWSPFRNNDSVYSRLVYRF